MQPSQYTEYMMTDVPTDEESDYSVGDISLISKCDSTHYDDADAGEDVTELDIFQLDKGDLVNEEEFVPQCTDNPTDFSMHLFEEVDDDQRFENSKPLPECSYILNHDIDIAMELEATQVWLTKLEIPIKQPVRGTV